MITFKGTLRYIVAIYLLSLSAFLFAEDSSHLELQINTSKEEYSKNENISLVVALALNDENCRHWDELADEVNNDDIYLKYFDVCFTNVENFEYYINGEKKASSIRGLSYKDVVRSFKLYPGEVSGVVYQINCLESYNEFPSLQQKPGSYEIQLVYKCSISKVYGHSKDSFRKKRKENKTDIICTEDVIIRSNVINIVLTEN